MSDATRLVRSRDVSRWYTRLLVLVWTVVIGASAGWTMYLENRALHELALDQARIAIQKDIVYRRWMAEHRGVYVWATDRTKPSEYLSDLPERDVVAPQGLLTLINPARACRHVYEMESESQGVRTHLTSLRPVRPENGPDDWERTALTALNHGTQEVWEKTEIDGVPYLRLMRPLVTERACLKCHAEQGYRMGDVRGGIGIAVPLRQLQQMAQRHVVAYLVAFGLVWLLGLCGIGLGSRHVRQQTARRRQAEDELHANEIRLHTLAAQQARLRAEHLLEITNEKLRLAAQIQQRILPGTVPTAAGLEIAAILKPADATSGDCYDYLAFPDGSVGLVVADVSGHGLGPALLATETCAYLRALATASSDASAVLTHLNDFLCGDIDQGFVTVFLAQIDPRTHTMITTSAGHPGYLFDPDGQATVLEANSQPLGMLPNRVISCAAPQRLVPGQVLVLFTDGLPETSNPAGELFGAARAIEVIRARLDSVATEIAAALYHAAREFAGAAPQEDDITVLVLKVTGTPA